MNLIFGCTTKLSDNHYFPSLKESIERNYAQKAIVPNTGISSNRIGYIEDGGTVLGYASDTHLSLIFLGALYKPLPGWNRGSPLDDPYATAEYLLSRYQQVGLEFLYQVCGQYAIVIYHHDENRLILANDHSGTRVIFCTEIDDSLIFSTNLYSLAEALGDRLEIDRSLEDFMLIYGFLPWNRTVYRKVQRLERGAILEWHKGKSSIHKIEKFDPWKEHFANINLEVMDEDATINTLYDAFMLALEEMACSANEVAVLLGGFDSALVASGLKQLGKNIETFSFHYANEGFNQPHTDTLASYLGIQHNWVEISPQIVRDGLISFVASFNQPSNWPNYLIQTKHLCSVIRNRGFAHCYSGDGCDVIFLGYPRTHTMAKFFNSSFSIPKPIIQMLATLVQFEAIENAGGRTYRVALNILRNFGRQPPMRGFLNFRIFDEISLKHLRKDRSNEQEYSIEEILFKLTKNLKHLSPDRLAYRGKSSIGTNKSKISGSSDAAGVTILSPYLHAGLASFAKRLPDRFCRPEGDKATAETGKYILAKMAEKKHLLPDEIIFQPKLAAVSAPIDDWYMGPLRNDILEIVKYLPFNYDKKFMRGLIASNFVRELYVKYLSGDHLTTHEMSLLLTYAGFTRVAKQNV